MFDWGQDTDSRTFTLLCRGEVRLYRGTIDCTPKAKKGRALLAILAAEQRPLPRIKIIDLLWSGRPEEQARASLRTLLADIKEHLGEDFGQLLTADRERVGLAPGVISDLQDLRLAQPGRELFEGLDHLDPELDDWLRMEREKWHVDAPASRPALISSKAEIKQRLRPWGVLFASVVMATAALLIYS